MISKRRLSQLTGLSYMLSIILPPLSPKIFFLTVETGVEPNTTTAYFEAPFGPGLITVLAGGQFTGTFLTESGNIFVGILLSIASVFLLPAFLVTGFVTGVFLSVIPIINGIILLFNLTNERRWYNITRRFSLMLVIALIIYLSGITYLSHNIYYYHVGLSLLTVSIGSTFFILER